MARDIQIMTEAQLRDVVSLDLTIIDVVEKAFSVLATGDVIMPPILSMDLPMVNGEVDIKTAYIPGFDGFAIKVSPGFFDNPSLGIPSLNGLMTLFNAKTGLVEALYLDNGYLTDIRTAAAGAVAARHLAVETVNTVGVMGAGVQARLQMQALALVRPFEEVLVWGRDPDKAAACAKDLHETLGVRAQVASAQDTVRQSQIVVTTTPSREPILKADWLHEGLHITAMGSDQDGKNEIDVAVLEACDLYVADRVSQTEKLGELRAAKAAGVWTKGTPPELGAIINKTHSGRPSAKSITVCDLTGTGAQDTAIASYVRANWPNAGTLIQS